MRTLGYYDGYLGFLSEPGFEASGRGRIIDVGVGTGAFSEAWAVINGAPDELTLLEPSGGMIARAEAALHRRGIAPRLERRRLDEFDGAGFDEVLAAHVIEHCPDPLEALRQMRELLRPGGRLRLVVSKPHWCNAIIWLQWRHRTFGDGEIAGLIQAAGFEAPALYRFPSGPPSRTSRGLVAVREG